MQTQDLFEIRAPAASILLDNTILCSADRILGGHYEAIRGNPLLQPQFGRTSVAGTTLVAHDLINLSILVDTLFCYDRIYVNADFIDRWNSEIASGLLTILADRVVGITVSQQDRWEAESAVIRQWPTLQQDALAGADNLAQLVAHANHDAWSGHSRLREDSGNKLRLLAPYNDEATRPFPDAGGLIVGAGFYVACSQVLGIPYRPSVVRSEFLRNYLTSEVEAWRQQAGTIALDMLEKSAAEVRSYFERLAALNLIEIHIPLILGAVVKQSKFVEEILPRALQLRDLPEAAAFRQWASEFDSALSEGSTTRIAKYVKELDEIVGRSNKRLKLAKPDDLPRLSIGFGPVGVSKAFRRPAFTNIPIRIKSHAWILQHIYETVVQMSRFSNELERLILPGLPSWLSDDISIHWKAQW
jgi:hypothetical protein